MSVAAFQTASDVSGVMIHTIPVVITVNVEVSDLMLVAFTLWNLGNMVIKGDLRNLKKL